MIEPTELNPRDASQPLIEGQIEAIRPSLTLEVRKPDGSIEHIPVRLQEGVSPGDIEDIVGFTNTDKRVQENTTDLVKRDQPGRFANEETFRKWYDKTRFLFLLKNESGDILGILWYGPSALPDDPTILRKKFLDPELDEQLERARNNPDLCDTYAIRAYAPRMGVGNLLTKQVIQVWKERNKDQERYLWLEVLETNETAIRLYKEHDFEHVATKVNRKPDGSVERQLVMLLRSKS